MLGNYKQSSSDKDFVVFPLFFFLLSIPNCLLCSPYGVLVYCRCESHKNESNQTTTTIEGCLVSTSFCSVFLSLQLCRWKRCLNSKRKASGSDKWSQQLPLVIDWWNFSPPVLLWLYWSDRDVQHFTSTPSRVSCLFLWGFITSQFSVWRLKAAGPVSIASRLTSPVYLYIFFVQNKDI